MTTPESSTPRAQWIADTGTSGGCNPPTNDNYCPGDNVTRDQMAAFPHRASTRWRARGTYSIYFVGKENSGDCAVDDIALAAMHIPVAYGTLAGETTGTGEHSSDG